MQRILALLTVLALPAVGVRAYDFTTVDHPLMTLATGINHISGGIIPGYYIGSGNVAHGFLYDGSSFTAVDHPSAGSSAWQGTFVLGYSAGDTVGYYRTSGGQSIGFLYDGSSFTDIIPPGSVQTFATDIFGGTSVGSYINPGVSSYEQGFSYDGSTWTTLNAPLATRGTRIMGISGSTYVGFYLDDNQYQHGFVYDGSTWTTLDHPLAAPSMPWQGTIINDVNGNNLVGAYLDASGIQHGFLYDGTTWATIDVPGATGTGVSGIEGSTLVGGYQDAGGVYHGFITTFDVIPEPCSALLMALGGAGLMLRRRRV